MFKSVDQVVEEGSQSYEKGTGRAFNPYSPFRPSHWSWLSGWLQARSYALEKKIEKMEDSIASLKAQEDILNRTIRDLSASSSLLQHEVRSYKSMLKPTLPSKHTEPITRKKEVVKNSPAIHDNSYGSNTSSPYADPYWALSHDSGYGKDRRNEPDRHCDPDPVPSRSWNDSCSSSSDSSYGCSSSSSDSGSSCSGGGD